MPTYTRYQAAPSGATALTRRRGVASLLAMLFLVVFAALAVGFYAQTNMSVQVSNNDRRSKEALMAAEAGLHYIRYELSRVTIPMMAPPTPQLTNDQVFEEIHMDLKTSIEATGSNLENGDTVGDIVYDNNPVDGISPPRFDIPADPKRYLRLTENGPWFRVRVEQSGRDVIVTTVGKSGNVALSSAAARGVKVRFNAREWPNSVFTYGMASPNTVNITVAKLMVTGTQASILSTYTGGTPVTIGNINSTLTQPTGIAGNISLMSGAPNPSYVGTNYLVNGLTTSAAINAGINRVTDAPEWPTPDVSVFTRFATTLYTGGTGTFKNIYLDPAVTPTVAFDQNSKIMGVLYVKKGVSLSFSGGVQLQCVIVGEPAGTIATNTIKFSGNGVAKLGVETLPTDDPAFDGVRELPGTFIVAPKWDVSFAGNFVSAAGSVIADKITFAGNSPATIVGSMINLGNYPLTVGGSSALTLQAPTSDAHPGLRFTERFAQKKGSYKEVTVAN